MNMFIIIKINERMENNMVITEFGLWLLVFIIVIQFYQNLTLKQEIEKLYENDMILSRVVEVLLGENLDLHENKDDIF